MIQQRSFWMYILLSLVTCGIYSIYFWYKLVDDVNIMCQGDGEETQNYIIVILLSLVTCGIYGFYWYYKLGNRLQMNAPRYTLYFQENGTTILLWKTLGIFALGVLTYVGDYLIIKNINLMADAFNGYNFGQGGGPTQGGGSAGFPQSGFPQAGNPTQAGSPHQSNGDVNNSVYK